MEIVTHYKSRYRRAEGVNRGEGDLLWLHMTRESSQKKEQGHIYLGKGDIFIWLWSGLTVVHLAVYLFAKVAV